MIPAVPAPTPVTTAEADPTVAIEVLEEVQVPPPASVNADVKPTQTIVLPVMAEGAGLTVMVVVAVQPEGMV